jgi:hypothetical protein
MQVAERVVNSNMPVPPWDPVVGQGIAPRRTVTHAQVLSQYNINFEDVVAGWMREAEQHLVKHETFVGKYSPGMPAVTCAVFLWICGLIRVCTRELCRDEPVSFQGSF